MAGKRVSPKVLAEKAFTQDKLDGSAYTCFCGKRLNKNKNGFTNLAIHLHSQHPYFVKACTEDAQSDSVERNSTFAWLKRAVTAHAWLEIIIMSLLPFSFCQNDSITRYFVPAISLNTFMTYMHNVTKVVECRIAGALPNTFALVFDGWSCGDTHYLTMFATYRSSNKAEQYSCVLLCFSPLHNETSLCAEEHLDMMMFHLGLFGKDMTNVVEMIADNTALNPAIADLAHCAFIGCASYRFNLAVQDVISEEEELLDRIRAVMRKLRNLVPATKLRKVTRLKAKLYNLVRWSSSFEMIKRYRELQGFLSALEIPDMTMLLLSPAENQRVDELFVHLKKLNSVTVKLQYAEGVQLHNVRRLFDGVVETFKRGGERLNADAAIVKHKYFENGIVKLQLNKQDCLTASEVESLRSLEVCNSDDDNLSGEDDDNNFAERLRKCPRVSHSSGITYVPDLRFLLPTSNICEQFLSKAGHALGERRKGLYPSNLEEQMFLHFNRHLWGLAEVNEAVNTAMDDH